MTVTLLGPQRRPSLRPVMAALDVDGPVAVVNAGWRHREDDDAELLDLLDGRGVNLALYRRWLDVATHDPSLAEWEAEWIEAREELSAIYGLRLRHAMAAVTALQRREAAAPSPLVEQALDNAVEDLRRLDRWHLASVRGVRERFAARDAEHEHPRLAEHRARVAELLDPTTVLVVAGGHVGVLLDCLRLFDVRPADRVVVAWSAGAMALAERVVLYNDFAPQGDSPPEVHDVGLGVFRGVVPLPHARRRLRLDDEARSSVLARRLHAARCLVLDDGVRVDVGRDGSLPPGARVLDVAGRVGTVAESAA
jgi:hypothetical protein